MMHWLNDTLIEMEKLYFGIRDHSLLLSPYNYNSSVHHFVIELDVHLLAALLLRFDYLIGAGNNDKT